ncbi:isopentenyl-diphosphate Delta-isomerase [Nesterenkonia ebinurensis]|uniref:isopentenyl-diphosphate Delta-isomerase n=1 Tax=Nesterenkonia ebinurensis TaxID=2608252 RepID=UPI00123D566E|nr:isopentenyl-diphosphate Delta-isomerase [Nesterenkonia ebinurensis]
MNEAARQVVLLAENGEQCGTALKEGVHTAQTPLHLGFSCHVFNLHGQVLITRRSLHKHTWPGVWTNSFCGHPQPGEDLEDAVRRHARHELGLTLEQVQLQLPHFQYRAADASGIVENEICPVFTATAATIPQMNPSEVCELTWVLPEQLGTAVHAAPWVFSPWLVLQAQQMPLYQEGREARLSGRAPL